MSTRRPFKNWATLEASARIQYAIDYPTPFYSPKSTHFSKVYKDTVEGISSEEYLWDDIDDLKVASKLLDQNIFNRQ